MITAKNTSEDTIFVQIASYRDPELLPTIESCLQKAHNPGRLRFGICWQRSEKDQWPDIGHFYSDPRFLILDVDYSKSKGACWARSKTQTLYRGENFSLQIDSHSRFVDNWDKLLLDLWYDLSDPKAIFTGYPPSYFPDSTEDKWDAVPHTCRVTRFTDPGTLSAQPHPVPDYKTRTTPVNALHIAGGFIFGPGEINHTVPYDPELYFIGEESSLALRFFTHGYNMYHPHKNILYHFYLRKEYSKHWSENPSWVEYSNVAKKRLNALIGKRDDIDLGIYGLGSVRTLDDFIKYSGIDYHKNKIHADTRKGIEPPCSNSAEGWKEKLVPFKGVLEWDHTQVPTCDDPKFWAIFVCDEHKESIFRKDMWMVDYPGLVTGDMNTLSVDFVYDSAKHEPTYILVWPYSHSGEWEDSVYLPLKTKLP